MADTKFTPGPWDTLVTVRTLIHVESRADETMGKHICSLPKNDHANAHLIAAAPAMYAALEALYAGVSGLRRKGLADAGNFDGQVWMTPVLLGTLRKIGAALKAARGEK